MNSHERERFDRLVEGVVSALPAAVRELLAEVPLVVEDLPGEAVLRDLGMSHEDAEDLCGLHTGIMRTERSVEDAADIPSEIRVFRVGTLLAAGGWEAGDEMVAEEIRITVLHELGHEMGLGEGQLDDLGYS